MVVLAKSFVSCGVLYVTVSVHFIAHVACNLSIRHAKHARLLTREKDSKNEMACVFSIMALDRDGYSLQ